MTETVSFEVICDTCGRALEAAFLKSMRGCDYPVLSVEVCSWCIELAQSEASGVAFQDGYEEALESATLDSVGFEG